MRLNPFFMPALVIGALLGTTFTAQALGQWSISGRAGLNLEALTAADIKGWMTLQQVSDGLPIAQTDLYRLMAIPADVSPNTALKDLESIVPGFEVSVLREKLLAWQSGSEAELPTAPAPTPIPIASTPVATPTPAVDHTGLGGGSGTGPTPLPAGQVLPAEQIKGRMSLAEISTQCAVPLGQLLAALNLPANTDPALKLKDLIGQGRLDEVATVQTVVAVLQSK